MENLKVKEKTEMSNEAKELRTSLKSPTSFLISLSEGIEAKRIKDFNNKVENCPYSEKEIINTLSKLCESFEKAKTLNDSFQVWLAIPEVNNSQESFDNECLIGLNVYESKGSKEPFCTIDVKNENGELTKDLTKVSFGDEYYIPNDKMCSNYLVEPQVLIENLYIELNGVEIKKSQLDDYLSAKFEDRLDQETLKTASKSDIEKHLKSGGIIFDVECQFDKEESESLTLENLKLLFDDINYYTYFYDKLYSIREDEKFVYFKTDKRVLENESFIEELQNDLASSLEVNFLNSKRNYLTIGESSMKNDRKGKKNKP